MKAQFLALILLAAAGAALAQAPAPPPGADAGPMKLDNIAILLDLTDAQKSQVKSLLEQQHAKMHKMHEERMKEMHQRMEQMRAAHEQAHQELLKSLAGVLNPTQMKKAQILIEAHMPGHHMPMHGNPMGDHAMSDMPGCMPMSESPE